MKLYYLSRTKVQIPTDFLEQTNKFNIEARYPEEKYKISRSIDKKTIGDKIFEIEKFVFLLCNKRPQ